MLSAQKNWTIDNSYFDPRKETKVIIHGFIDTPLSTWVKVKIKKKIFNSPPLYRPEGFGVINC